MKTSFIVFIALVLCTFAAAQRLEFDGENFAANRDMKKMAQNIGFQWLENKFGLSMEDIKSHLGLLVAGVLHFVLEDFSLGTFNGEQLIPMIMG